MRILMTIDAVGGVWRYGMELAAALKDDDVAVVFAGLGPQPSPEQVSEAERLGTLVWLNAPLDWMTMDEGELEGLPRTLERLIENYEVDVVHLNLPSQAAGLSRDIPVLTVSHSCVATWWEAMRGGPLPEAWQWVKRRNTDGYRRANAVVAPSRAHADLLQQCYGPIANLNVVHNAIADFPACGRKEDFVFAAARWWDESKNARVLDAAAKDARWPVVMAGATRGPIGQRFDIEFARRLGEIAHEDVLDHMRRAAVFVSPSLYEPFGLAALEAARAGSALLLSDVPTYRELWDGAALFFDATDPDSLSTALNRLSADEEIRWEWGERAHTRSRRFVPVAQAQSMASLYRRLMFVGAPAAQVAVEA